MDLPDEQWTILSPAHVLDGIVNTVMGQASSFQEPGSGRIVFTQNRQEKVLGRNKFILQPNGLLIGQLDNSCHTRCDSYLSFSDLNEITFGAGAQDVIQPFREHVCVYLSEFQDLGYATLRLFN